MVCSCLLKLFCGKKCFKAGNRNLNDDVVVKVMSVNYSVVKKKVYILVASARCDIVAPVIVSNVAFDNVLRYKADVSCVDKQEKTSLPSFS